MKLIASASSHRHTVEDIRGESCLLKDTRLYSLPGAGVRSACGAQHLPKYIAFLACMLAKPEPGVYLYSVNMPENSWLYFLFLLTVARDFRVFNYL